MELKNRGVTYASAVLFGVLLLYIFGCTILSVDILFEYSLFNQVVVLIAGAVVSLLLWLLFHSAAGRSKAAAVAPAYGIPTWEKLLVAAAMTCGMACRVLAIASAPVLTNTGGQRYYDMAVTMAQSALFSEGSSYGSFLASSPHSYLYLRALTLSFSFLGIKIQNAYYLNMLLQIGTAYFVYRIGRALAGQAGGMAALLLTLLLPAQVFACRLIDPVLLGHFLLFAFLFSYFYLRMYYKRKPRKPAHVAFVYVCCGLICGMAFLSTRLALYYGLLMLAGLLAFRGPEKKNAVSGGLQDAIWFQGLCYGAGFLLTFVTAMALQGAAMSKSLLEMLAGFFGAYVPDFSVVRYSGFGAWLLMKLGYLQDRFSFWNEAVLFADGYLLLASIAIFCVVLIWAAGVIVHLCKRRGQGTALLMWLLSADVICSILYVEHTAASLPASDEFASASGFLIDYAITGTFAPELFLLLAACGMGLMFHGVPAVIEPAVTPEGFTVIDPDSLEDAPEEESGKEEKTEQRKVKLLDNPLPLPKKHVPKVMDFDVKEPEETKASSEDDFDFDTDADDDFDI